uniref:phosphoethanolamine N-methyltransferase n=1 Tax=Heligmosomoides polygyrus TaxID=6339 RepID=A0A183G166_HELPZ
LDTMAAEVRRDSFKTFWDKFSDKPDTNSMMLNQTANDLEASDRADILSSLPHLTNKDVVDIGAGIGRFTTVLAETARWVHSTDFIESFIAKNQERNTHMGNISYQIGDAVHLQMDEKSVDLVFTNWLMMYLSDREVIEFLFNAMRWLRADGYLHLRESCSEPSTARWYGHLIASTNPTFMDFFKFTCFGTFHVHSCYLLLEQSEGPPVVVYTPIYGCWFGSRLVWPLQTIV